jgi:hypothetical protein
MEKIQYSLIYYLYKSGVYKTSKAYYYRANQSLVFALVIYICAPIFVIFRFAPPAGLMALVFLTVCVVGYFVLDMNVSKRKLYQHRPTYLNRRKYLRRYFVSTAIYALMIAVCYLIQKYS